MAHLLFEEGRDHYNLALESRKAKLMAYRQSDISRVRILTAGDKACPECKVFEGRKLSIDEALQEMPIPVRHCTKWKDENEYGGLCRCIYSPVIDD